MEGAGWRPATLDSQMDAWAELVSEVEVGYGMTIDDYTNDLAVREWLEQVRTLVTKPIADSMSARRHPLIKGSERRPSRPHDTCPAPETAGAYRLPRVLVERTARRRGPDGPRRLTEPMCRSRAARNGVLFRGCRRCGCCRRAAKPGLRCDGPQDRCQAGCPCGLSWSTTTAPPEQRQRGRNPTTISTASPSFAPRQPRRSQPTDRYPCRAIPRGARPDVPLWLASGMASQDHHRCGTPRQSRTSQNHVAAEGRVGPAPLGCASPRVR